MSSLRSLFKVISSINFSIIFLFYETQSKSLIKILFTLSLNDFLAFIRLCKASDKRDFGEQYEFMVPLMCTLAPAATTLDFKSLSLFKAELQYSNFAFIFLSRVATREGNIVSFFPTPVPPRSLQKYQMEFCKRIFYVGNFSQWKNNCNFMAIFRRAKKRI